MYCEIKFTLWSMLRIKTKIRNKIAKTQNKLKHYDQKEFYLRQISSYIYSVISQIVFLK